MEKEPGQDPPIRPTTPIIDYASRREESYANSDATLSVIFSWAFAIILPLNIASDWSFLVLIFPVWPLCAVAAIYFGISGLRMSRLPYVTGRNRARMGIVVGIASLVLSALTVAYIFWALHRGIERSLCVKCASNLRQIGQAVMVYANNHGGQFPYNMGVLITQADLNPEVFVCPSRNEARATGSTSAQTADALAPESCSYVYLGTGLKMPVLLDRIIAREKLANHEKEGMNILYGDGRVEWVEGEAAEWIIKELNAGRNPPRGKSE